MVQHTAEEFDHCKLELHKSVQLHNPFALHATVASEAKWEGMNSMSQSTHSIK